jgi:phosphoglycerol geranylgeranyltransferase
MQVIEKLGTGLGQVAVLIDPDKVHTAHHLDSLIEKAEFAAVDYLFIGGSTVSAWQFQQVMSWVKVKSTIPVVIFPGSNRQVSNQADALLYLSLISGRNAEFLIGQHVENASEVFNLGIEVIPTGYILVDGMRASSVSYVSQTTPIPRDQIGIAVNTALAGYMLGQKCIFFDAGSGAMQPIPVNLLSQVRHLLPDATLIVGGGVRDVSEITAFTQAGANVVVVGNKIEEDIDFLLDIASYKKQ